MCAEYNLSMCRHTCGCVRTWCHLTPGTDSSSILDGHLSWLRHHKTTLLHTSLKQSAILGNVSRQLNGKCCSPQ